MDDKNLDRILHAMESLPPATLDEMARIAAFVMEQKSNPVPADIDKAIHLQMVLSKEIGAPMEIILNSAIVSAWVGGYLRGLRAARVAFDRLEEVTSKMFNGGDLPKA